MSSYFAYLCLGFTVSLPTGPVHEAQSGVGRFWSACMIGMGALVADALYMIMIYLGFAHFIQSPFVQTLLWSFGGFVLLFTGLESMLNARVPNKVRLKLMQSGLQAYVTGFMKADAHPLALLYWLGVFGSVMTETALINRQHIPYAAFIVGMLLSSVTIAALISRFSPFKSARLLAVLTIAAGFPLFGFGLYFAMNAIHQIIA